MPDALVFGTQCSFILDRGFLPAAAKAGPDELRIGVDMWNDYWNLAQLWLIWLFASLPFLQHAHRPHMRRLRVKAWLTECAPGSGDVVRLEKAIRKI